MAGSGRALTAEAVEALFGGTADLCRRELRVAGQEAVLFFIDGLTAGGEIAETVLKPLRALRPQSGAAGSVSAVQTERLSGAASGLQEERMSGAGAALRAEALSGAGAALQSGAAGLDSAVQTELPSGAASTPQAERLVGADSSVQAERPAGAASALQAEILSGAVYCAAAEAVDDLDAAAAKLLNGFCVLCLPEGRGVAFEVKTGEKRGPSEPEVESTTRGPKDAFTETSRTNTSLVRRHLRSTKLRIWETSAGADTHTNLSLLWVEGKADPGTVARMQRRLEALKTRELLTPAAVETAVTGHRGIPAPLIQYTERTDKFARGLLEGRVGLFADGLPVGYLVPVSLRILLQAAEDRDTDPLSKRFLGALRVAALLIALLLPALYVAMAAFHQEMLPTPLLEAIIESKRSVPFPTAVEILGLLLAFEILQEAGLSAPKAVSQPVSIIGGLVVGTAAVEANLISPAALILVSAAGICGFALPGKSFVDAVRLCRLALTVCAALAGLWGLTWGFLALLVFLARLESFGTPWLAPEDAAPERRADK